MKVLITGAASGIGWHLACEFLRSGASVIPVDFRPIDIGSLKEIGDVPYSGRYDVGSYAFVSRFAKDIGTLDALVNNAGIPCSKEMAKMEIGEWKELVDTNLMGPINHMVEYLPGMIERGSGRIVNVSSGQAFFRLPTWGAYSATKAALGVISELLDFEVRKHGVRVTTVYPFMVNTPFYEGIEGDTFIARSFMKLIPFYSNKPETVARKIFEAVSAGKRVEMINPINFAGVAMRSVPLIADAVTWMAERILADRS